MAGHEQAARMGIALENPAARESPGRAARHVSRLRYCHGVVWGKYMAGRSRVPRLWASSWPSLHGCMRRFWRVVVSYKSDML